MPPCWCFPLADPLSVGKMAGEGEVEGRKRGASYLVMAGAAFPLHQTMIGAAIQAAVVKPPAGRLPVLHMIREEEERRQ